MRLTEEEKTLLQRLRENGTTNEQLKELTCLIEYIISKREST